MKSVILLKGKEKQPLNRHSYIFSGAVEKIDKDISPGEVVRVISHDGKFIAYGHFNPTSGIIIRLLEWNEAVKVDKGWYRNKISSAIGLRKKLSASKDTDAFRMIFSEGDFLPGLIVDKFADVLVLQSHTSGMDRDKEIIAGVLRELLPDVKCIYEKSDGDGRKLEGLKDSSGVIFGTLPDELKVRECGISYKIDIRSQKTGFYTDQRTNRIELKKYIKSGDSVLDLFSFSGGFGLTAAVNGAEKIVLCDSSVDALSSARSNFDMNGVTDKAEFVTKDCFEYIRELYKAGDQFDIIIADPPKLMPKKKDEMRAMRAYKDLNFNAIKLVRPGGYMLTFSCSGNFTMQMFKEMIAYSAKDAKRTVQIIAQLHQADDHPVSVSVPETEYLKGLILRIL
ncbi:MAG TPA: class I SAM-dependent rRNA methyltransferase [Clostridiales bacterium]|nr:class I SAM-dependent rRNA methyltransferase [Clostridiales bacterium]